MNSVPLFVGDQTLFGFNLPGYKQFAPLFAGALAVYIATGAVQCSAVVADQFIGRIAGQPFGRRIDRQDVSRGVEDHQAVLQGIYNRFPVFDNIHQHALPVCKFHAILKSWMIYRANLFPEPVDHPVIIPPEPLISLPGEFHHDHRILIALV